MFQGIDHAEYFTSNADTVVGYFRQSLDFRVTARNETLEQNSLVLRQGGVALTVTEGTSRDDRVSRYLNSHGDGFGDLALRVTDVKRAFEETVARGAKPIAEPKRVLSGATAMVTATVGGFGDVVHTFVARETGDSSGEESAAHREPGELAGPCLPPTVTFEGIDHVALCVQYGELNPTVDYYTEVFGFKQIFEERISVGGQSMASKVVQDEGGGVTFTIVEPDGVGEPGQLDDFLDKNRGPGIQHLAFSVPDIKAAVRRFRGRAEFLTVPDAYYEALREAPQLEAKDELAEFQELSVLLDQDHWGWLMQIFTRSFHPQRTVFLELIQRRNARTFGSANIRALYEAVERERRRIADADSG